MPGFNVAAPARLCLDFLEAQGSRDLERARSKCAPGFRMVFPGGHVFTEFTELIAWAAPRYRSVAKTIERVEEAPLGETVSVYITGTLHGEWLDGTEFSGIRFVDRFEVRAGRIASQKVWNDMAGSR